MSRIKAIIFDMDGVLSDTQLIHSRVESKLLGKYGIKISPDEITKRYSGVKTNEFFHELLKNKMKEKEINSLLDLKWNLLIKEAKNGVSPIKGSKELVSKAKKSNMKIAVASASIRKYVVSVLAIIGLINEFETIITGNDVTKGKPNPEIFLKAAKKLGVPACNCLVIEDSISGMVAAKRAGMKCVGLVKDKNKKDVYPADTLVESLNEINLNAI